MSLADMIDKKQRDWELTGDNKRRILVTEPREQEEDVDKNENFVLHPNCYREYTLHNVVPQIAKQAQGEEEREEANEKESMASNIDSSQRTLFTEYETIEIAIKIIDLLQMLHSQDIIHTNLSPENIFVKLPQVLTD